MNETLKSAVKVLCIWSFKQDKVNVLHMYENTLLKKIEVNKVFRQTEE